MWPFRKRGWDREKAPTNQWRAALGKAVRNEELKVAMAVIATKSSAACFVPLAAELNRATFLVPLVKDPSRAAVGDTVEVTTIKAGTALGVLVLEDRRGDNFLPLFTDWDEVAAWRSMPLDALVVPAPEAWKLILGSGGYAGGVVNPGGKGLALYLPNIRWLLAHASDLESE